MENKELQELFAAKRTTEANRRRQEELRRMMVVESGKRKVESSRRLWPVWAGAAAASVALLIVTLPLLFTNSKPASMPIAKADVPAVVVPTEDSLTPAPAMAKEPVRTIMPTRIRPIETAPAAEMVATAEEPIAQPEEEPIAEAPVIDLAEYAEPTTTIDTPSPRIHRRTSSRMVNSSNIETIQPMPSDFQNFLASAFGTETDTPFNLTTFNL